MGQAVKRIISPSVRVTWLSAYSMAETSPVSTTAPVKRSRKPISTAPDFVAISHAMIDASLGVIVRMPIAETVSGNPNFLNRSFPGLAMTCASVTCLPGHIPESSVQLCAELSLSLHHLTPHSFMWTGNHRPIDQQTFFSRTLAGDRDRVINI